MAKANEGDAPGTVQSTATLLRIIDLLRERDGAGVTELADQIGVSKSTVYRHLVTLRENEYVVREGTEYRLSYRFLDLGGTVRRRDVTDLVKRKVSELAEETGERVQYVVEEHGRGVFAFRRSGEHGIDTGVRIGTRTHLTTTSAGKAILARLPPERVKEIIETHGLVKRTPATVTSVEELHDELDTIRSRGYATDRGEYVEGIWCVGAPILSPDDEVTGALSVAGVRYRMNGDRIETELPRLVKGVTNEIELKMAYG